MKFNKKQIIDLLNYLDRRGIIFENEDLVNKTLKEMRYHNEIE